MYLLPCECASITEVATVQRAIDMTEVITSVADNALGGVNGISSMIRKCNCKCINRNIEEAIKESEPSISKM